MSRHFAKIGKKFRIEIVFPPIGVYKPKSFHRHHLNPKDALDALENLGAKLLVPMHWGTFDLSWEPFDEPPTRLAKEAAKCGIGSRIRLLKPGESIEL